MQAKPSQSLIPYRQGMFVTAPSFSLSQTLSSNMFHPCKGVLEGTLLQSIFAYVATSPLELSSGGSPQLLTVSSSSSNSTELVSLLRPSRSALSFVLPSSTLFSFGCSHFQFQTLQLLSTTRFCCSVEPSTFTLFLIDVSCLPSPMRWGILSYSSSSAAFWRHPESLHYHHHHQDKISQTAQPTIRW